MPGREHNTLPWCCAGAQQCSCSLPQAPHSWQAPSPGRACPGLGHAAAPSTAASASPAACPHAPAAQSAQARGRVVQGSWEEEHGHWAPAGLMWAPAAPARQQSRPTTPHCHQRATDGRKRRMRAHHRRAWTPQPPHPCTPTCMSTGSLRWCSSSISRSRITCAFWNSLIWRSSPLSTACAIRCWRQGGRPPHISIKEDAGEGWGVQGACRAPLLSS